MVIRSWRRSAVAVLILLLLAALPPAAASGAEPLSASPAPAEGASADPSPAPPGLTQEDAVALVLASDARFAGLPDWDELRRRSAAEFKPYYFLESNVRVLPSMAAELASWELEPRSPGSWLIAVTLVRDCSEWPPEAEAMTADPCGWRHSWYYRVEPDGTLSLLFDEGDPE